MGTPSFYDATVGELQDSAERSEHLTSRNLWNNKVGRGREQGEGLTRARAQAARSGSSAEIAAEPEGTPGSTTTSFASAETRLRYTTAATASGTEGRAGSGKGPASAASRAPRCASHSPSSPGAAQGDEQGATAHGDLHDSAPPRPGGDIDPLAVAAPQIDGLRDAHIVTLKRDAGHSPPSTLSA